MRSLIPILLESDREFESAWVETKRSTHVRILGMKEGDSLRVIMTGKGRNITVYIHKDGKIELSPYIEKVKAIHHRASGSRVSVELLNGT